jgi:hypothetical protein
MASFGANQPRSTRGPLASFDASAIGFVWRTVFFSGHWPPATMSATIQIAREPSGREVPTSSSSFQIETFSDSRDDRHDFRPRPPILNYQNLVDQWTDARPE